MSASADIIIGQANGLVVPASAVKSAGGASYVLVFNPPLADSSTGAPSTVPPTEVPVTTGLSSATEVQITSGLTEGEQVVVSTSGGSQTTAKSSAAQSTSVFGGGGSARPAGGATFRAGG